MYGLNHDIKIGMRFYTTDVNKYSIQSKNCFYELLQLESQYKSVAPLRSVSYLHYPWAFSPPRRWV